MTPSGGEDPQRVPGRFGFLCVGIGNLGLGLLPPVNWMNAVNLAVAAYFLWRYRYWYGRTA